MGRDPSNAHTAALRRAAGREEPAPSGLRLSGLVDSRAVEGPELLLRTPSGQMRRVPVSERQLVLLIQDAANALERINREREGL